MELGMSPIPISTWSREFLENFIQKNETIDQMQLKGGNYGTIICFLLRRRLIILDPEQKMGFTECFVKSQCGRNANGTLERPHLLLFVNFLFHFRKHTDTFGRVSIHFMI